jgi:tetratricopeptide (TPR) repeat protein
MRGREISTALLAGVVFLAGTARAQSPASAPTLSQAKAAADAGRFTEAERLLRACLQATPKSGDAEYLLGYVLFRNNNPRESLAAFTRAAAIQRPAPSALKIVGLDYALLNDYPDAVHWLERSVVEDPRDAEAVYHLGRAYYVQNSFDKAIAAFDKALRLNPLYAKAQNNLGLALAAAGKVDAAESAYRRAIDTEAKAGNSTQEPYVNLAELLIREQRTPEAAQLLETAAPYRPKSERLDEVRGRAYLNLERLDDAEQAFRAALSDHPQNGSLHYQLGRVLKREGKADEAQKEFDRSQTLLGAHSSVNQ